MNRRAFLRQAGALIAVAAVAPLAATIPPAAPVAAAPVIEPSADLAIVIRVINQVQRELNEIKQDVDELSRELVGEPRLAIVHAGERITVADHDALKINMIETHCSPLRWDRELRVRELLRLERLDRERATLLQQIGASANA